MIHHKKLNPSFLEKILGKIEDLCMSYRWKLEKKRMYDHKKILIQLWLDYDLSTKDVISCCYSYLSKYDSGGKLLKELMKEIK